MLAALVEEGRSIRGTAAELGLSATAVRHWLGKYELKTRPLRYVAANAEKPPAVARESSVTDGPPS